MADIVMKYDPKKVLDVGCGMGTLVRILRQRGVEAYGIDFAEVLPGFYWQEDYFKVAEAQNLAYKDKEFDVVISSDFFEHILEEDIDRVANEMRRVGKKVLARIAYYAELTPKQKVYHVTNKPKDWWESKLKEITIV